MGWQDQMNRVGINRERQFGDDTWTATGGTPGTQGTNTVNPWNPEEPAGPTSGYGPNVWGGSTNTPQYGPAGAGYTQPSGGTGYTSESGYTPTAPQPANAAPTTFDNLRDQQRQEREAALGYFNTFSPEDQANIRSTWNQPYTFSSPGGSVQGSIAPDRAENMFMRDWYRNAQTAGAVPQSTTPSQPSVGGGTSTPSQPTANPSPTAGVQTTATSQPAAATSGTTSWRGSYSGSGEYNGYDANYGAHKMSKPGANATPEEIRKYSWDQGWGTDDMGMADDATIQSWINEGKWDAASGRFRNDYGDLVDKPWDDGPNSAGRQALFNSGRYGDPSQVPAQGGGGGGGNSGGGGYGGGGGQGGPYGGYNPSGGYGPGTGGTFQTYGGAPQFQWDRFVAPNPQDVYNDPSYQFRLGEGINAIEGSAAARGLLRTGGTLRDITGYGQDLASQEYGAAYDRALQGWGANYQGTRDAFAPAYGSWENTQNQALQKYLQREGNIFGLINSPAPMAPGY